VGNYLINEKNGVSNFATFYDETGNTLYECSNENNSFECNKVELTDDGNYKYFFDEITKTVIYCKKSNDCTLEDPTIKGYFINSGYEATKVGMKCTGGNTTLCSKVSKNDLKYIITSGDKASYKTVYINSVNGFPGVDAVGNVNIKEGNDGSTILLEDTGLPACTSTSSGDVCFNNAHDNMYCIKDKKIYKTSITSDEGGTIRKSCQLLEKGSETSDIITVYFDKLNKKVDRPTQLTNYIIAYICSFKTDTGLEKCEFVKGYVMDNDKLIQCSGWKRDGCTVIDKSTITPSEDTSCNEGEGKFQINKSSDTLSNVLCFKTRGYAIPSSVDYIAFQATGINPIYGVFGNKIVFLSMTPYNEQLSSVIVVTDETHGKSRKNNNLINFFLNIYILIYIIY